ncbi:hypothetical protein [Endozoicomonas sp. SCSIO W0465]|uniref:hypothetical protein n=1 Tax=Endozoicomonas sp. SCSIO W0465 TaxID=2918516 RepID=UPI002075B071|nr:hypothetical protein [Endozoicomonas sp. SCSIO W0465]USE36724.1 hypothetical protein MJO57_00290 [Endozoicomonas sp. SCSIO W0465]
MNTAPLPICIGINRLAHPLSRLASHNLRNVEGAFGCRSVITCNARHYSNKLSRGDETTDRKNTIRKIGKIGGQQNLVRLLSDDLLKQKGSALGASSLSLVNITNIFEFSHCPIVFSASLGLLVAGKFIQGVNTSIKPEFDNMSSSELEQELALKQACLKAQVRKALDKWFFDDEGNADIELKIELNIDTTSYYFDSNDYGFVEHSSFKKLGIDFESSLGRQDVLDALANDQDGFDAKKRLLGELQ